MGLGLPELLIIFAIILLVFGAGKLPQVMGQLGKGVTAFKEGANDAPWGTVRKASEGPRMVAATNKTPAKKAASKTTKAKPATKAVAKAPAKPVAKTSAKKITKVAVKTKPAAKGKKASSRSKA